MQYNFLNFQTFSFFDILLKFSRENNIDKKIFNILLILSNLCKEKNPKIFCHKLEQEL